MKHFYLLPLLAACAAAPVLAQSFCTVPDGNVAAISPDGTIAVGYSSAYDPDTWVPLENTSFTFDTATGKINWVTEHNSLENNGKFTSVTSDGYIFGSARNPGFLAPKPAGSGEYRPRAEAADDDEEKDAIPTACYWDPEGKRHFLPIGDYSADDMNYPNGDGIYLTEVSANRKTAIGYVNIGSARTGLMWTRNEEGSWEITELSLPSGCSMAIPAHVSADGMIIYGRAVMPVIVDMGGYQYTENTFYPMLWQPDNVHFKVESNYSEKNYYGLDTSALSPDGRHAVYTTSSSAGAEMWLIDTYSGEKQLMSLPVEAYDIKASVLTDDLQGWATVTDAHTFENALYHFSLSDCSMHPAGYYLDSFGEKIQNLPYSVDNITVAYMSHDGRTLAGVQSGWPAVSYVMTLPGGAPDVLETPADIAFYYNSSRQATLSWSNPATIPEGVELVGFQVTFDGEELPMVEADPSGSYSLVMDAEAGTTHTAVIKSIGTKEEKQISSSPTEPLTAFTQADHNPIFFDNFDDTPVVSVGGFDNLMFDQKNWLVTEGKGVDINLWHVDFANYVNNTPFLRTGSYGAAPWESILLGRWLIPADAKGLYAQFYATMTAITTLQQDFSDAHLVLEASTDGKNWEALKDICANQDVKHNQWQFFTADLSAYEGSEFQLRFRAYGNGASTLYFLLDYVGVNNQLQPGTDDLLLLDNSQGALLSWPNETGCHNISYLSNEAPVISDTSIGNAGAPLMIATDFTEEKLAPYVGRQIRSVNAMLYDSPVNAPQAPTEARILVFDGEQLIAEGTPSAAFDLVGFTEFVLDKPVEITPGKTLRVALDLVYYDPNTTPIHYQTRPDQWIPGVTDLFSEDGGKTWQLLSDLDQYQNPENPNYEILGYAVWSMGLNTVVAADTDAAQKPARASSIFNYNVLGYNVYKNGELLTTSPVYYPNPTYLDTKAVAGDKYQVRAYGIDGLITELSNEVVMTAPSGIEGIWLEAAAVTVDGLQAVVADAKSLSLYTTQGMMVARSQGNTVKAPAKGLYILSAETPTGRRSIKIAF